ncbi:hypothetical protein FQA39_LY10906 [Lamprigera yunnana]|nr:hypothetical protein FQA39_LY10906 [Lamprigera yunnana]
MFFEKSPKQNVCRTCFQIVQNGTRFWNLNTLELNSEQALLKKKLEACVPEIIVDRVNNSIICDVCVGALNVAYDFKTKCVENETKIYQYMAGKETDTIDLCNFIQNTSDILKVHSELPSNGIKCLLCKEWFDLKEEFRKHMDMHAKQQKNTITNDAKMYKCKNCNFMSAHIESMRKHSKKTKHTINHGNITIPRLQVKNFPCKKCDYVTSKKSNLYKHNSRSHPKSTVTSNDISKPITSHEIDVYQLTLEDVTRIVNNENVDDLMTVPTLESNNETHFVTLEDLGYLFNPFSKKNKNSIKITEEQFSCPICKAAFKFKYLLKKHLKQPSCDSTQYTCKHCGYADSKKISFDHHMRKHTTEKFYQCDECDFTTIYLRSLPRHKLTHRKEAIVDPIDPIDAILTCDECSFQTQDGDEMKIHLNMHIISNEFIDNSIHNSFFQVFD